MTDTPLAGTARIAAGEDRSLRGDRRYDGVTMTLHWITAILVVTLFGLAHLWDLFPHDGPTQVTMQTAHVSLGVILASVLVVRLVWRFVFGRHLPPVGTALAVTAARGVHSLLYGLLIVMVVAGFGKRWVRQHGVEFFGWSIPSPVTLDPAWRPAFNWLHHWGAWAIITVAGLHAAAALFHHLVLRDRVLRRMIPAPPPSGRPDAAGS